MASSLFIIFALIFPAIASAKDFVVGDKTGWTFNFDYQAWANGKDFQLGDRLVFKYPVGAHNVFKVNGTGFQNCIKPPLKEALTSGNDKIVLATTGQKWYICGVGQHCATGGQKLLINVGNKKWKAPINSPSKYKASPDTNSGNDFGINNIFYTIMAMTVAVSAIFGL